MEESELFLIRDNIAVPMPRALAMFTASVSPRGRVLPTRFMISEASLSVDETSLERFSNHFSYLCSFSS